jgi:type IX secretion system PorP/SprF family membrane protein
MNSFKKLKLALILGCLALTNLVVGQQMNFSQFQLTPMLNNPSLISLSDEIKADVGYRNQFGGRGSNYATPFVSVFKPFYQETAVGQFRKFGAGGIQILEDRTGFSGMLATTGFSVSYTQNVNLSKRQWFSLGLQPGFYQRRIDVSRLQSGSQWDGKDGSFNAGLPLNENITGSERVNFFTINTGLTYVIENRYGDPLFTLGVAANNLTQPNISLIEKPFSNPINWNIQTSFLAYENAQFLVRPSIRHIQVKNQRQTNIGTQGFYKIKSKKGFLSDGSLGLGLWYSNQNALITSFEINQKSWALAFSYDFLVSTLSQVSQSMGSPEIIIGFRKYLGKNKKKEKYLPGDSGNIRPGDVEGPKKVVPSNEIKPEKEIKPEELKIDSTILEKDTMSEKVKPETGIKPTKTLRDKTGKGRKISKAGTSGKKAGKGKIPARKPVAGKKAAQNNISDPAMAKKLAALRTADKFLGVDPYKGTKLELSPAERALFRKQPRFDFGSKGNRRGYEIDQVTKADLDKMAKVMKARPDMVIEIGGYGCDLGTSDVNLKIATGRAESVRRYLLSKGVKPGQMVRKSYGSNNPQAPNTTEEGKMRNRRVQYKFLPKKAASGQNNNGKSNSGKTNTGKASTGKTSSVYGRNPALNNISNPAMAARVAALVTSDSYLGQDPYKGTKLELSPSERDIFKQQPHYELGTAGNRRAYELDKKAMEQLDKMVKVMKARPKIRIEIGGYGCDLGSALATSLISGGRAEGVRRYLVSKGIPSDRFKVKEYGMNEPQSSNSTEDGKMDNRRVQFKFIP